MNRIDALFSARKEKGGKALAVYATSGDPTPKVSAEVFRAAVEGGADLVEIGVPYSDPTADGPAIQAASVRALKAGGGWISAFADARALRESKPDVATILFGYANPFLRASDAAGDVGGALATLGADGALCVDLPPEEDDWLGPRLTRSGLHPIRLVAPTSTDARIAKASEAGGGFLYCVAVAGVTGTTKGDAPALSALLRRVRKKSELPVMIGFGISTPDDAARMAELADGVVVGSAVVRIVEEKGKDAPQAVERFVKSLKAALR